MALGTGIGQARGLLRRDSGDYWIKRIAADMQAANAERAKQKAKQQEELATAMDFKIDYGKYLPAWGREVANVYADFINDVATMRQQNPNVSALGLQARAQEAKRRIGELDAQNEMAKKYLQEKDIMRNEQFDKALVSFDSTFETLNKASNAGMYHVSPRGGFNYRQIPSKEIPIEWGQPMQESLPVTRGGYREITMEFPGGYESYVTEQKKKDPIFRSQVMFNLSEKDKGFMQADNETDLQYAERMDPIVDEEIKNLVKANRPPDYLKYETVAAGGGGGKDTRQDSAVEDITLKVPNEKGVMTEVKRKTKAVKAPGTVNVNNSGNMYSADTNQKLPAGANINFKPTSVDIAYTDGSWKMYAKGVVTKSADSDGSDKESIAKFLPNLKPADQKKWANTYEIMVPLEGTGVKSYLETHNLMNNFYKAYEDLKSKTGTKTTPKSTGSIKVQMENGSVGEIPSDQWPAFKKKYPKAKQI